MEICQKKEAIGLSDIFKTYFAVQPLPAELRHREYCICLPPSANLIRDASVKNKSETNSVIEEVFSESPRLRALTDLFDVIVEEPLFNQLRTKEQLGYTVQCAPRVTTNVFGFCFYVQSAEYNPIYLQGRVEIFINSLEELLVECRVLQAVLFCCLLCVCSPRSFLLLIAVQGCELALSLDSKFRWWLATFRRKALVTFSLGSLPFSHAWG